MDPDVALFARVIEAGSLSAAGRALGISPATMSKRIARLEQRIGARLLHRTTRQLRPTARGERFYQDVSAILAAMADAEARAADRAVEPTGPLRVSAPTSFGRLHIAPHIKPFLDRFARLDLEFNLSDSFADVAGDAIDLAIRIAPAIDAGLIAVRLADSRRVLCAAPRYLEENGVPGSVAALADHRLLAATGQLPWRLFGPDGPMTVGGSSHVRTNSSDLVRELALSGGGIALRSLWDVNEHLVAGDLVRILPEIEGSDVGIYAVHARGTVASGTHALIAYLHELWSPAAPWDRR